MRDLFYKIKEILLKRIINNMSKETFVNEYLNYLFRHWEKNISSMMLIFKGEYVLIFFKDNTYKRFYIKGKENTEIVNYLIMQLKVLGYLEGRAVKI